jgi:hypothetical protein
MGSKRLEDAAAAAGFAMVNPEDFAREISPSTETESVTKQQAHTTEPNSKSWLNWDYLRLMGGKATA